MRSIKLDPEFRVAVGFDNGRETVTYIVTEHYRGPAPLNVFDNDALADCFDTLADRLKHKAKLLRAVRRVEG